MLAFIQQIKKIVYTQAILLTVAYILNKSGAIGVQHSSTPLSPPPPFYTHAHKQVNAKLYHVLQTFPSTKNAVVLRAGPLPGGSEGCFAGPAYIPKLSTLDYVLQFCYIAFR